MTDGPVKRFLDDLAAILAAWVAPHLPPRRPLPVRVRFIRERIDAMGQNILVFEPVLPKPGDTDVVERVLSVTIDGATTTSEVTAGPGEVEIPEGKVASLSIRERDQDGRWGDPSDPFEVEGVDQFQPGKPGQVGVKFLREFVREDPPADEPAPTEPPPPEEPSPGGEPAPPVGDAVVDDLDDDDLDDDDDDLDEEPSPDALGG